jgi:hypothetical protein
MCTHYIYATCSWEVARALERHSLPAIVSSRTYIHACIILYAHVYTLYLCNVFVSDCGACRKTILTMCTQEYVYMCVCVYIYIYIYTCRYVYVYTIHLCNVIVRLLERLSLLCARKNMFIYMYVCIYIYLYMHICICIHDTFVQRVSKRLCGLWKDCPYYVHARIYVCIYIYVYICVYIHIYMYICIFVCNIHVYNHILSLSLSLLTFLLSLSLY